MTPPFTEEEDREVKEAMGLFISQRSRRHFPRVRSAFLWTTGSVLLVVLLIVGLVILL
jgi:hypothetical protein